MMPSSPRPFRFGVQITRTRGGVEWRAQARRAEELGYDIFLMADHFGNQLGIGPALAAVAGATSTIRIGTLVIQNDLRHPALLAKDAATLDILSEGRFELGIGAGGSFPPEFDWIGIPLDPPATRVGRLEEAIEVLKGLAGPEPFTFTGTQYTFNEYNGYPKPVQQPWPPLLIAGGGQRMLTLAARHADIVGLLPSMLAEGGFADDEISLDAFARKVEFVQEKAGDRFPEIELNILIQMFVVTDNRETEIARRREEMGLTDDAWFASPMVYVGSEAQIVERMQEVRERLGVSYFVVFEPVMEAFAPIVQALAGK